MNQWLSEKQTDNLQLGTKIINELFSDKSLFQDVAVVESAEFGRMLVLDGIFQTSLKDEFVYHEMIVHVPLLTHPKPKKVLIIGGGDGGSAREALKHQSIEQLDMVEIDGMVVDVCKQYLPEIAAALINADERFNLIIGDGIAHVVAHKNYYDVIIVDCSDPVGPGEGLFTTAFYQSLQAALAPDGLFVQQTESPWYHQQLIRYIHREIKTIFPVTKMYLAHIPLYPGGMHSFIIGSKQYDPAAANTCSLNELRLRYLNCAYFSAAFALPEFVSEMLKYS
ncbi:MAG: polyamine aminopropyltransferase [Negativicutes bacterium]|jgi:spermidine synthase